MRMNRRTWMNVLGPTGPSTVCHAKDDDDDDDDDDAGGGGGGDNKDKGDDDAGDEKLNKAMKSWASRMQKRFNKQLTDAIGGLKLDDKFTALTEAVGKLAPAPPAPDKGGKKKGGKSRDDDDSDDGDTDDLPPAARKRIEDAEKAAKEAKETANEEKKKRETTEKKARRDEEVSELSKALKDAGVADGLLGAATKYLSDRVSRTKDGKIVYMPPTVDDPDDEDAEIEPIDLGKGIGKWKVSDEAKPFLGAKGSKGSGSERRTAGDKGGKDGEVGLGDVADFLEQTIRK